MPVRWHGKGFARRQVLVLGGAPQDIHDTMQALIAARGWTFGGAVADIEAWAEGVLKAASRCADASVLAAAEEGSAENYAAQFLRLIRVVRREVAAGNADGAARFALQLGLLVRERALKVEFETAAEARQAQIDAFSRRRDAKNRERRDQRKEYWSRAQQAANGLWKKHPTWGAQAVAERIKTTLGLGEQVDTIRKRIKKSRHG